MNLFSIIKIDIIQELYSVRTPKAVYISILAINRAYTFALLDTLPNCYNEIKHKHECL